MDSSSVRKEAKKILDNFAISLGKVKVGSLKKDNSFNNGMRKEGKGKKVDDSFRKVFFENAPQKDENCIIGEKKKW